MAPMSAQQELVEYLKATARDSLFSDPWHRRELVLT